MNSTNQCLLNIHVVEIILGLPKPQYNGHLSITNTFLYDLLTGTLKAFREFKNKQKSV